MSIATAAILEPTSKGWPRLLKERLGLAAVPRLHVIGPKALLAARKVALFCSARTPGSAILPAHDAARRMRDDGTTVISGFHSPIEKECLRILLRGKQPIIICPGRAIDSMRIPSECRAAFDGGRILFLSPFTKQPKRVTKESAFRRNQIVAALADQAYVAHIETGGNTAQIVRMLTEWKVPLLAGAHGHSS